MSNTTRQFVNSEPDQTVNVPVSDAETDKTELRETPWLFAKGFAMGSADVVPGVSGGTLALITGIYTRLIFAVRSLDCRVVRLFFFLRWKEAFDRLHWKFLAIVLSGAACAILFFTKIIVLPVLMHTRPELIYGLFFGLIGGSIFLLLRTAGKLDLISGLMVLAGGATGYRIVTLVPTETPETAIFVFFSGSLAISAMVLPGISGSFILLILRKYDYILGHIGLLGTDRTLEAMVVLVPFGLGMIAGLVIFVRLLSWLLRKYRLATLCLLIGFMTGSLYVIWPYQDRNYTESVETRVIPVSDPRVRQILETPPDTLRPEYARTGPVVNPGAPPSEQWIEYQQVRRRLSYSRPAWPNWADPHADSRLTHGRRSLFEGMLAMFAGFALVGFLASRTTRGEI